MTTRELQKRGLYIIIVLAGLFTCCAKSDNGDILPTVPVRHIIIGEVITTAVSSSDIAVTLGGDTTATATTSADGSYAFYGLKPGKYIVSVTSSGSYSLPKSIDLSNDKNSTIATAYIVLTPVNKPTSIVASTGGKATCQTPYSAMNIEANIPANTLANDSDITLTPIYANIDIKPGAYIPLIILECLPNAQQFTSPITIATDNAATPIVIKNITLKTRVGVGTEWIDSDDKTIVTHDNGYTANITHFCEYMFAITNAVTATVNTMEDVAIQPNFDNTNGSSAIKIGYVEYTQKSGYEWITPPIEAVTAALGAENIALQKIIGEAISQTYTGRAVGLKVNEKALYPLSLVVPKGSGIKLSAQQKCTETTFTIAVTANGQDKSIVVKTKQYNETAIIVTQYSTPASSPK